MKKILVADANKASLVMTSEIFKDQYPGIQVCTAHTSADAIQIAQNHKNFDAFIIDFDLSDQNGASTALKIKKISKKIVLITAFENREVLDVLGKKFVKFPECQNFLKKPLQADMVRAICEFYWKAKTQPLRTVKCDLSALIQLKSVFYPIVIEECALNLARFKLNSPKSSISPDNGNHFLKINNGTQVVLKVQNPLMIELDQTVKWNTLAKTNTTLPTDSFNFTLTGKIFQKDLIFWIEFDDVLLSTKIFEAILTQKNSERFKNMHKLFF